MNIYKIRDELVDKFPHIFGSGCLYARTLGADRLHLYVDYIKEPYKSEFFKSKEGIDKFKTYLLNYIENTYNLPMDKFTVDIIL